MMILEHGTHPRYVGIGSRVRLLPANQKVLFSFICDAKLRIIQRFTWQRYIHPRMLILRSHTYCSRSSCMVRAVTLSRECSKCNYYCNAIRPMGVKPSSLDSPSPLLSRDRPPRFAAAHNDRPTPDLGRVKRL